MIHDAAIAEGHPFVEPLFSSTYYYGNKLTVFVPTVARYLDMLPRFSSAQLVQSLVKSPLIDILLSCYHPKLVS